MLGTLFMTKLILTLFEEQPKHSVNVEPTTVTFQLNIHSHSKYVRTNDFTKCTLMESTEVTNMLSLLHSACAVAASTVLKQRSN